MRPIHPRAQFAAVTLGVATLTTGGAVVATSPAEAAPPVTINASLTVSNPSAVGEDPYRGTGTVRILGTLTPGDVDRDGKGDVVKVWGSRNGNPWRHLGTTTTDPESGTYAAITQVPDQVGEWKYAVTTSTAPSTAKVSAVLSKTVTVKRSRIHVNGFGKDCKKAERVKITGFVRPAVADRLIRVQRRLGVDGKWRRMDPKQITSRSTGNWAQRIGSWQNTSKRIYIRAWLWEPATDKWIRAKKRWFKRCN